MRLLREIGEYRELLLVLVARNIKIRYKGSALGFLWTLLNPIFLIAIYAVFLSILRFRIPIPILVTGILVWQFLSMCMGYSLHAVIGNANLVKKTTFPRIILPLSMVVANFINFLLSLVVLFAYLLIVGADFGNLLWLPVIIATQCALCLGIALIFSASNVFFRDTEHSLQVISMAWFFLTPVIYPLKYPLDIIRAHFPEVMTWLFFANPMAGLVSAYRMVLLSTDTVPARYLAVSAAVSWLVCAIGIVIYQRLQERFADEL